MAPKILATLLAAAVLSVGGYTYWQYADGCHCCNAVTPTTETSAPCPVQADSDAPPCCQEPSRTSCFSLPPGESCCADAPVAAAPEVLNIPPREVK